MKKYLSVIALIVAAGCGKAPPSPAPAAKAAHQTVSALVTLPFQQRPITDEQGTPTVTAPPLPVAPAAIRPVPTASIDSVIAELDKAVNEIAQAFKQASDSDDSQTIKVCRLLLQRLHKVCDRLPKPNCNLADELDEIRAVRAVLNKAH